MARSDLGGVEDLIRRFASAKQIWEMWRSLHQEAFDYASPQRENFNVHSTGQRRNRHIFDSTAVTGLVTYANRIQGSVYPSWQNWMKLGAGSEIPKEERAAIDTDLEAATDVFFSHLNNSNFDTETSPALADYGVGTGAVMVEEGDFASDKVLRFSNVPLSELFPEPTISGPIESAWRQQEIEAGKIKQAWPDAELPNQLATLATNKPHEKIKILNGVLHDPKDNQYHQIVIHEESKSILFEQTFATKRLIVFRETVTPGETFGRGPIIRLLPDIRTANKVKQFVLENAAIQMAGVYTGVDDGIFNPHTARIVPGGIIPVKSNNPSNPTMSALPRSGDLGLGSIVLEDLQNNIKKQLFADPFGEFDDPTRTLGEQLLRKQEMLRNSGAAFGRLKSEFTAPLVAAVVKILQARGLMPQLRVDGREVKIVHISPLAQAEKMDDFQNSQIWLSTLNANLPPEVVAGTVKVEEIPKKWQEMLGVPADLVRTKEEIAQFGQAVATAAEAGLGQGGDIGGGGA